MFAGCRIEGVAARGGMGIVYRATQLPLGRAVALKLVSPDRAADSTFLARFEREARLAASIEHPNVIPVYAAGEEDGRLYIVMRWVEGTDLHTLIAESGALEPGSAAAVVAQVGAGLDAAHAAGLVHRDVKPANVLIAGHDATGHAYLTDFGLTLEISADTRLTESGAWLGSVNFMAPEQFEAGRVDMRTDVYALGCLLHTTLTGEPPFARRTVAATMRAHLDDPPPRPSDTPGVPEAFDAVVARAMAKRPDDRYQSAGDLVAAALAASGAVEPPGAPAPAPAAAVAGNGSAGVPEEAATTWLQPVRAERSAAPERPEPLWRKEASGEASADDATRRLRPTPARAAARPTDSRGPTAKLQRSRRRRSRVGLLAACLSLVAVAAVAVLALADPFGSDGSSGPVSRSDVRDAVEAFADAYAKEDAGAMADAVTANVTRVTPADTQRGRAAVVRQYRRQFAGNATKDYELSELEVQGGAAGRASARYKATLDGEDPLTGTVVFGVRRDHGEPRVALIALTPER
jgi:serine/threonine-protein kinase